MTLKTELKRLREKIRVIEDWCPCQNRPESVIEINPDGTIRSGEYPPECPLCKGRLTGRFRPGIIEIHLAF